MQERRNYTYISRVRLVILFFLISDTIVSLQNYVLSIIDFKLLRTRQPLKPLM